VSRETWEALTDAELQAQLEANHIGKATAERWVKHRSEPGASYMIHLTLEGDDE
jgi:hypothetical protein